MKTVKSLFQFGIVILLFGLAGLPANAAFRSLYVFGDALSSTADNLDPRYYQGRDSNGRVWIEVLAQRQGLTYDVSKNISYYDHNSAITVTDVKNFRAPADVTNDLFIVWVCNADTFDVTSGFTVQNKTADTNQFIAAINQSQTNHFQIITNLYAKGVRTLLMPNAVDISEIPAFNAGTGLTGVEHYGCVAYNAAFSNTINRARALCPGLKIYTPDFFSLLNNVLTNAANYGLTNALSSKGFSIDALTGIYALLQTIPLNGPGTNYVFWDNQDPTAQFHEVMADVVQQIISPVQIGQITALNGSNRLDVVNVPVGLNGFVDGCTNLVVPNWTVVTNFITSASTNTSQSVFTLNLSATNTGSPAYSQSGIGAGKASPADIGGLPEPGGTVVVTALQFYRLRFPYAWSWP